MQFSATLRRVSPLERAWLEAALAPLPEGLAEEDERRHEPWRFDEQPLGVSFKIEGEELTFYELEIGNVEALALLMQVFLATFRVTEEFGFTWAETEPSNRYGNFTGGACVVRAHGPEWLHATTWLSEKVAK